MSEQRTPEWYAERCGKVTASRIHDVIARTKTGWGASRANYMADLIAERLTGVKADRYVNAEMQHGIEMEPAARSAYEFYRGVTVEEVGFIPHPMIALSGASPDGHVGDDGMVEIKCPNTATHIDTLLGGTIPARYAAQMMWQLACTGRKWNDFVSFDPRLPESMCLFIQRIHRDEAIIAQLEKDVLLFLAEMETKLADLTSKYGQISEAA